MISNLKNQKILIMPLLFLYGKQAKINEEKAKLEKFKTMIAKVIES